MQQDRLKEIERHIKDKVAAIQSKFINYGDDLDRRNKWIDGFEDLKFDQTLTDKKLSNLEELFNASTLSDMRHRHHTLTTQMELLNRLEGEYLSFARIFNNRAQCLLEDADRKYGLNPNEDKEEKATRMTNQKKGLYYICAEMVQDGDNLDEFRNKYKAYNPETHFISQVFEKVDNNYYSDVSEDAQLRSSAKRIHELHQEGIQRYREIKSSIDYLFGTTK